MESKKFNWNKLLNGLIAGIAIILASVFIGLCFIVPTTTSVKASLKKSDIESANIYFKSAKTKIRKASSYDKVRLQGFTQSNDKNYFYSYNYNYDSTAVNLYSKTPNSNILSSYSNDKGNVYLNTNDGTVQLYETLKDTSSNAITYKDNTFISTRATSFLNENSSSIEDIFYDEIDDGDFVLINNYEPHSDSETTNKFDVENFYMSFGTPYINGENSTTPIHELSVQGVLYAKDKMHYLSLNEPQQSTLESEQRASYWYQYFDLKSLTAHVTSDPASDTYDIQDQQGKYVITFEFIKYIQNAKGELEPNTERQTFTYTFYLLDSTNYDMLPSITNAELGKMQLNNSLKEYFYNYNTDYPYITYDPESFNVSYTKENREVTENITSTYALKSYSYNGRNYPLGIISFYNNGSIKKQVYILTYYNTDKNLVEYLYLADNSGIQQNLNTSTYENILSLVNDDTLKFEYKKTQVLSVSENGNVTTYTTKTYLSYDYKNRELSQSTTEPNVTNTTPDSTRVIKVTKDANKLKYEISYDNGNSFKPVAEISNAQTNVDLTKLSSENGVTLNKTTLEVVSTDITTSTETTWSNYKLVVDSETNSTKITKTYYSLNDNKLVSQDISLGESGILNTVGTFDISDPIDSELTIRYTVSHDTTESKNKVSKVEIISHIYKTENVKENSHALNLIESLDKIEINVDYRLEFDTLGVYTFDYKYMCLINNNDTQGYDSVVNNTESSTNILNIKEVNLNKLTSTPPTTTPNDNNSPLYLNVWGYINDSNAQSMANQVTLNGVTYVYDSKATSEQLSIVDDSQKITLNTPYENSTNFQLGDKTVKTTTFTVSTDAQGRQILNIRYEIGSLYKTIYTTNTTYQISNNISSDNGYILNTTTKTENTFNLAIDSPNDSGSGNLGKIPSLITNLTGKTTTTASYSQSKPNLNGDILHVFGSETYFNKVSNYSDTGYSKLKLVDSKTSNFFESDITKYVLKANKPEYNLNGKKIDDTSKTLLENGFAPQKEFVNVAIKQEQGLNAKNIIVTDITPVFFKNLSSLIYENKVSKSYIYRYPDYKIKSDGTIDYGTAVTDIYTKDTYCQFDGLYEIVVFYKYDGYKSLTDKSYDNTLFCQYITFIIDNSSPSLSVKVSDDEGNYNTDLGLKKFTNKNVELSWDIPTYFKNDVYLDIERLTFDGITANNFVATYKQNNMTATGNQNYAKEITQFVRDEEKGKYYVYITSKQFFDSNGDYRVTLHYSSRGASTVTQKFTIDKQNISGLKTLPVIQVLNNSTGYAVNNLLETSNNQIVNYNFTFRYDPKLSKAKIYTYWYRIDLIKTDTYNEKVDLSSTQSGITTDYKVNGYNIESISSANQYLYNYDTSDDVLASNYFSSSSSSIYLFKLVDEAGNECRYVVFYDTTTPGYVISPTPLTSSNIIADSAIVTFGDYKAIKISTPDKEVNDNTQNYQIDLSTKLDNYTKAQNLDKLKETLCYINSFKDENNFNNTSVQNIDGTYYLLLPLNKVTIQDKTFGVSQSFENSIPSEYYFFPSNPVKDNKLKLPKIKNNSNGTTSPDGHTLVDINSVNYTKIMNTNNEEINKFMLATSSNRTYNGAIGSFENGGSYEYEIFDKLGNKTTGIIWINPDKTQTQGYGIFDVKTAEDNLSNVVGLGDSGSFSASKLYISSKQSNGSSIPDYTLTYKYYQFSPSSYVSLNQDYNFVSAKTLDKNSENIPSDLKITGEQKYIVLNFVHKVTKENKSYYIEINDEMGVSIPQHSYPYELEGTYPLVDSNGSPKHIYSDNVSSYVNPEEADRIYSSILNPNADETGRSNSSVTQEGLYVFKRKYNKQLDSAVLGEDRQILYIAYYVDRTGIINVATLNSFDNTTSQDFGFILGSDYKSDYEKLKKHIDASSIQNSQTLANSSSIGSNSHYSSSNLFSTNKIQVQYNLFADKYNFDAFVKTFNTLNSDQTDSITQAKLNTFLFNKNHFANKIYKVNLTIAIGIANGETDILDENKQIDVYYNTKALSTYVKGMYKASDNSRLNSYNFYFEDNYSSPYKIYLKDSSGYNKKDGKNVISNYQSNELDLSFSIKHTAPEGDMYGKYYGRHDYDEDKSTNHSIPLAEYTDENGNTEIRYNLLGKYLSEGQLDKLSSSENILSSISTPNGQVVKLSSTNNESLIFTFQITKDDTQAQIDPENIQIYKGSISESNLIFNRVKGTCNDNNGTALVKADRMQSSYFANVIDGITYHAIVIFDNNLDEILNKGEEEYSKYRLLDSAQNNDSETYFIVLNYIGDKDNYIKQDNLGNKNSYFSTTFEVTVDRNKPIYNLTKLMSLDKYVQNNSKTTNLTNYKQVFESYKNSYNFTIDEDYDFERSYLENYFFALDYRTDSSFEFEHIDNLDNKGGIYIRKLTNNTPGTYNYPSNYKFSITPDDYKAYYEATYLPGHPQFSPNRATPLTAYSTDTIDVDKYYYIPFDIFGIGMSSIKVSDLVSTPTKKKFLEVNNYYEILEVDEAGNYRVYAVYLPDYEATQIKYEYKINNNSGVSQGTINSDTNTVINLSGMNFGLTQIKTFDYYLRANLTITSDKLNETLLITYEPNERRIYVRTTNGLIRDKIDNVSLDDSTIKFISTVNSLIENYNNMVSTKGSNYYTQYGHLIQIDVVDRIGIKSQISNERLFDYEITYNVAGSILSPTFKNNQNTFTMTIPAKTGTTHIKQVRAYVFAGGWSPKDPDELNNSFYKTESELIKGTTYTLGKGVYKFEIIDNFERINNYFYEFGSTSSQAGGYVKYSDNYVKHTDNYTYTGKSANFVYDNHVYDIYIKYIGDTREEGVSYSDDDINPKIIYSSNKSYSDSELSVYGLSVATIDNITTITLMGVTDLTKYHIKTIPATLSATYNYTWGMENTNKDLLVYDTKLAIYTGVQDVIVRNSNGNTLDTNSHLNLSEDFEVTMSWTNGYKPERQLDFDSKVVLKNTDTNKVVNISTNHIITDAGNYEAYVINSLNTKSQTISFTRSEGDIGIYSVFAINNKVQTKLSPSAKVSTIDYKDNEEGVDRQIIEFNYFTLRDYFSFVNTNTNLPITIEDINDSELNITDIDIDKTQDKYLEVQVKSDLNIFVQLYSLGIDEIQTPYAEFRVFTKNEDQVYTYRFIKVYFVENTSTIAFTKVVSNKDENTNIYTKSSAIIKRPDTALIVTFEFKNNDEISPAPISGNTIYVDRYFNNQLVETLVFNDLDVSYQATFTLNQVGLYRFAVRDLAGRTQTFGNATNPSQSLQIYLINQILFTVNGNSPINNQIFNDNVNIKINTELAGLTLYDTREIGITVTHNGQSSDRGSQTEFTLTEPGSYTVVMTATTKLSDDSTLIADQQVTTTYKFTILKTNIAQKSFNVSKGTGFVIDKIFRIKDNEKIEITEQYKNSVTIKIITTEEVHLYSDSNESEKIKVLSTNDYIYTENYNPSSAYTKVIVRDENLNLYEGYVKTSNITASKDSLLWLSSDNESERNCIFEVTLKYFNSNIKGYESFSFNVWINNALPSLISSIPDGNATKDVITINFNPGMIFSQVGKSKILVNDKEYLVIDENSERVVQTMTINEKGTYIIKIVSDDGSLISSYKFTKNDPLNQTTKIILICVAIGVVVLVVLFLLIRRKGKYR